MPINNYPHPHVPSTTRSARSSERPDGRECKNRDPENQNQIFRGGAKRCHFQHSPVLISRQQTRGCCNNWFFTSPCNGIYSDRKSSPFPPRNFMPHPFISPPLHHGLCLDLTSCAGEGMTDRGFWAASLPENSEKIFPPPGIIHAEICAGKDPNHSVCTKRKIK